MDATLTVLDLFCGAAGGWSLGLHRAGMTTVAACEIDEWRRKMFSLNNPTARMYDDVCSVTGDRLRRDGVDAIDVVCGSPPCQDASTANTKGKGIDGERTGLFWEFVRIVREVRPAWALAENVPGLRTRGYDRIQTAMEAAGYTVRPIVVGAWHAGAPHKRNRVWIIANRNGGRCGQRPDDLSQGGIRRGVAVDGVAADVAGLGCGTGRTRGFDPSDSRQPEQTFRSGSDSAQLFGPAVARDQPDGFAEESFAESEEVARRSRSNEPFAKSGGDITANDCRSEQDGRPLRNGRRSACTSEDEFLANRHKTGLGKSRRTIASEPQHAAIERSISDRVGSIAETWNGGIAGRCGVDDGIPKGMARKMLSAYGDAVAPVIPELIGRWIVAAQQNAGAE